MSRALPLSLCLALIPTLVTADGSSTSTPERCCFPQQFTSRSTDIAARRWAEVSYDFINMRKMVQYVDNDDYYYQDMVNNITYGYINGTCRHFPTPLNSILFQCIPDDAQLDNSAGTALGTNMAVHTWRIDTGTSNGEITVTDGNCYPVSTSFSDYGSHLNLYLSITNIREEVDPSVFPSAEDLSGCVAS